METLRQATVAWLTCRLVGGSRIPSMARMVVQDERGPHSLSGWDSASDCVSVLDTGWIPWSMQKSLSTVGKGGWSEHCHTYGHSGLLIARPYNARSISWTGMGFGCRNWALLMKRSRGAFTCPLEQLRMLIHPVSMAYADSMGWL